MGWIITYANTEAIGETSLPICSRNWTGSKKQVLNAVYKFRLLDDDGILYYEGASTVPYSFAPLDDFGRGDSGCTEIQYQETGGSWTTL